MVLLRSHIHHLPLLLLLLLLTLLPPPSTEDEESAVSIEAPVIAVEVGDTAEIECTTTENSTLQWFLGSTATGKSPVPEDSSLRVFANSSTGKLTVTEARLNDSGAYLCETLNMQHNATVDLHVYEMPSYLREGLIIAAVSAALLVLFGGGLLIEFWQKRQRAQKAKTKLQRKMEPSP